MSRKLIDNIIAIVGCAAVVALLFLASYAKAHDAKHHQAQSRLESEHGHG
jgi:hypothetical protein